MVKKLLLSIISVFILMMGNLTYVVRGDQVVAGFADIEAGEEVRGLARGGEHSAYSPFERSYARGDMVICRVLESGIEVSVLLEVEEPAHLVACLVFERCALNDRHLPRLALAGIIARLDA